MGCCLTPYSVKSLTAAARYAVNILALELSAAGFNVARLLSEGRGMKLILRGPDISDPKYRDAMMRRCGFELVEGEWMQCKRPDMAMPQATLEAPPLSEREQQ